MDPVASAEARIKQLCCLGLGGEVIMPAILEAMHDLVPSYANCFTWSGPRGEMRNSYAENMDELLPLLPFYFEQMYNRREEEVVVSFRDVMRSRVNGRRTVLLLEDRLKSDRRSYYRHDYYNLFLRPANLHQGLNVVVREAGVALGGFGLHRTERDPEFSFEQARPLERLMPFVAHALTAAPRSEASLMDTEREGLIVVDLEGRICHLSKEARRLLIMATRPVISWRTHSAELRLPFPVIRLCRRLYRVFSRGTLERTPPVYHHRNELGGFVFRAYWLNNDGLHQPSPEPASLIGVHLRFQEPLTVRILRRLGAMPALSRRQMQICLLLAMDVSNEQIAARMNMSKHTVVTHTRRIYDKLDVGSRSQLLAKITAT
ncbi:helix-turn-helix transcriptional regulator [Pistricoccus aurantiacus]|uniref:Helix-turn-helix transcriptional regulator n=1 Tax=Pistricoccus aurantiacus TaxID=1883414 RepID=A0A5B8SVR8_9GAMM|nr:helix-turn-helix transcriptional regulator [Pistricoccus aurantiacus]QEA38848.1 helix-turn-helix transcriptional regulator [Pistricoccus aurantiacus]